MFASSVTNRLLRVDDLKTHLETHGDRKNKSIRTVTQIQTIEKSFLSDTEENPFVCCECEESFAHYMALMSHLRIHIDLKQNELPGRIEKHCEKESTQNPTHSCDPGNSLICNVCGRPFKKRATLNRHMLVHTGEKPFVCKVCGRKFAQTGTLKLHMMIHTGEKPFACNTLVGRNHCAKQFKDKGSLNSYSHATTYE